MYYVYILECADASLYTGITTDIDRRLDEHKSGKASHYTAAHGAVKIVHTEEFEDRGSALRREVEIKKLSREKKLALVKD
ncbi:GIY-YIG nuclease family protein [Candidatus Kaiserbacteria bacterium]|nr:GIY-YIG nuclease family protein [Candidatus Kaiserbacteria bacterium]